MPPKTAHGTADESRSRTRSPQAPSPLSASRNASQASTGDRSRAPHLHAPSEPSRLRQTVEPSSSLDERVEQAMSSGRGHGHEHLDFRHDHDGEGLSRSRSHLRDQDNWDQASGCGSENCRHGTYSPRAASVRSYGSIHGVGDGYADDHGQGGRMPGVRGDAVHEFFGDAVADGLLGGRGLNKSTTAWLAETHGLSGSRTMYIAYYIPFLNWIRQYQWQFLRGDLIAAITMASFYIPMSLSYADNLGHIPPVNGIYSFVFNPFIYALLGSCPMMVVGPEAAGSLLTGQVVRENIINGSIDDKDGYLAAEVAGIVTFFAGVVIFFAGLFRLGFLDNVLSRPFLRGFISAIGIVIFIDQLIPELGLDDLAREVGGVSHGSSVQKAMFVLKNITKTHGPTCAVSFGAFFIIMVCREMKHRLQPKYPGVAYIPDRFIVVVMSAVFAWRFEWAEKGVDILGNIQTKRKPFRVHWPLSFTHLKYTSDAFSTAFVIALLGFFESSVAAKSLGTGESKGGLKRITLSANRELVALGVANMTGGLFMSLPAFGGYGRSKVNASTGGRTPMSSIFLSIITTLCVLFLLPYFYYIPKGVLSAMISVVAYSLLEEAPHDLRFFWRIRGWSELFLMLLIFAATIFWNLKIGIAVGIGLSLLRVIRHSTRPRIQILGRVPGTTDKFENAEQFLSDGRRLEFVEGCLIVKIPEPLTFANTGDLKARLKRLEDHGTSSAHPSLPKVRRAEHNKNVIFDVHGVTSLDGAGAQVLRDLVEGYRERGVRVFFCRVPGEATDVWRLFVASGIVDLCGGRSHFVSGVEQALKLTEIEDMAEEFGTDVASLLDSQSYRESVSGPDSRRNTVI